MTFILIIFVSQQYRVWHTVEKDPLFAPSPVTLPMEEQKRITQLQVKKVIEYKFLSDELFKSNYKKKVSLLCFY